MNIDETHHLLRDYAENGSERAFGELVRRYIDLVYSVAIRRVSGDAHRAEDVVQTVFTDLARKAGKLPHDIRLGGWLHRHSCFVAGNICRAEARRQAREKGAMDTQEATGSEGWNELAPMLDEAIEELDVVDRTAIIMRFFEQADLRGIGASLGISEDAAQKRVSRALDKLRGLLQKRRIALSAGALITILEEKSLNAAPGGWDARVSAMALAEAEAKMDPTGSLAGLLGLPAFKIILAALIGIAALGIHFWRARSSGFVRADGTRASDAAVHGVKRAGETAPPPIDGMNPSEFNFSRAEILHLVIVAADNGKPIPNVPINCVSYEKGVSSEKNVSANRFGVCDIALSRTNLSEFRLITRVGGFADTQVQWRTKQGERIPEDYTLRLVRPVLLSGRVLDEEKQPISEAEVSFHCEQNALSTLAIENHDFGSIEVKTDATGRWKIDRIAEDVVSRIYGAAYHQAYIETPDIFMSEQPQALEQMRAGTHIFHLSHGISVRGTVIDAEGRAISDARLQIGSPMTSQRQAHSEADGSFEIDGCQPGKSTLTGEATHYSPSVIPINVAADMEPIQITLGKGKLLRFRVMNQTNEPIANARIWMNPEIDADQGDGIGRLVPQVEFSATTDAEGHASWGNAPDLDLAFSITAHGYMQLFRAGARPDGEEHVFTLAPSLKISGTVQDADTHKPMPEFRIIAGWPALGEKGERPVPHWSSIERFWMTFHDGKFEHDFEDSVLYGRKENEFMFKFEAEGYAPFITRAVNAREGSARFEVELHPSDPIRITVLLPTGERAAKADLVFATSTEHLDVGPTGFHRYINTFATDGNGQFDWQADEAVAKIIAYHPQGFAVARPGGLRENPIIQLQPFGRLEGRITCHGKPVANRKLSLDDPPSESYGGDLPLIHWKDEAMSDSDGQYSFARVRPGVLSLSCFGMGVFQANKSIPTASRLRNVAIEAGITNTFNYDMPGAGVATRLLWPADPPREATQQICVAIVSSQPYPPKDIWSDREATRLWNQRPEIQALLDQASLWILEENPAGVWKNSEITPGDYQLNVSVFARESDTATTHAVLQGYRNINVPENTEEELDLGTLILEKVPISQP